MYGLGVLVVVASILAMFLWSGPFWACMVGVAIGMTFMAADAPD